MQYDSDLLAALRTDLAELTALHAPSGAEQPVIAHLRDLFTPLVDAVSVDHIGNLTATREGPPGASHIVVSAHADEIGALVASVEPDGFLRLLPIGGVQARLLEGRAVWVGGQPGVIGARSGHLTPRPQHVEGLSLADLYVDLGVDSAEEVEALGVRVGDPIVVHSELLVLAGSRVSGLYRLYRAGRSDHTRFWREQYWIFDAKSGPRDNNCCCTASWRPVPARGYGKRCDRRCSGTPDAWRHSHARGEDSAPLLSLARRTARLARSGGGALPGGGTRVTPTDEGRAFLPVSEESIVVSP
jgi:M42 glutamyl aminopeptidase